MANGLIAAKQVNKPISAYIALSALAVATSVSSLNVTSPLGTALGTLPLQLANSLPADPQGVVVTAGFNVDPVWISGTKTKLTDASGNVVYGRITQATGVYTVTFFTLVGGTETAYTTAAAQSLDILVQYQYSFGNLPADALLRIPETYTDPAQGGGVSSSSGQREVIAVTAANTLANTTGTPNTAKPITLFVNGLEYDNLGGANASFSFAGQTVTWSATNAGFSLAVADRVVIYYSL